MVEKLAGLPGQYLAYSSRQVGNWAVVSKPGVCGVWVERATGK